MIGMPVRDKNFIDLHDSQFFLHQGPLSAFTAVHQYSLTVELD